MTFAFTDIEGSTERWERDRDAMASALRRHDALMRAAIAEHGGSVFKTIGDAFCAAFRRPEDAVAAMLAAQRALGAADFAAVGGIRVRAAVHTGTADERDGDYFGPVLNRIARLLAIGHGGQVLLSKAASELVRATLPPQTALRDLGEHRLKGLTRAEHVYQLLAPGLQADFPAIRALDANANNLPVPVNSFIGREAEIAEISALLRAHRMLSVVGSGGVGKTRICLEVATRSLGGFAEGVWFVELAPLASGAYIASTVAQAAGLTLPPAGEPVANLARALAAQHVLLVFDNCEHLVEAAAHAAAAILRACPNVKILASSRQQLGVAGEEIYRLPSLSVPRQDGADSLTASEAAECAAIALFADRARAVDKRFTMTDENAPVVADICRRLDGIPLAIELAAARAGMLNPRQLRDRLDERFRVLTRGSRDALPRQQTLRALIDWSHELLDERERALFRRLATFANGCTLEGAVAVGAGAPLDEFDVFDVLASLVNKSLVLSEAADDTLRYSLLESTRAYVGEKLAAAGEREACASRHLRFLTDFFFEAKKSGRSLSDPLLAELEDVRAALDWALLGPDLLPGAELLAAIGATWGIIGLHREGLERPAAFIRAIPATESRLLARFWIVVATLSWNLGRPGDAFEAAKEALEHARASDDSVTLAEALGSYSWSAARLRRLDDAMSAMREAEAIADVPSSTRLRLLEARALVSGQTGDLASGAQALERLREEHRALGNAESELVMALNLAELEHERGLTQRAIGILRELLPRFRASRDRTGLAQVLGNLAGYLAAVDDLPAARASAREAIDGLAAREPEAAFVAVAIEHLALAFALDGDLERAAVLAGYSEKALQRHGYAREFTERTSHERLAALLGERLVAGERESLLTRGAALAPRAAIELALENR